MSKRKSFGRFTAMSLAGISAISSMAIVSNAEAYPTAVYEFAYNGIASTPMFASALATANKNTYVMGPEVTPFDDGFKVTASDIEAVFEEYTLEQLGISNHLDGANAWVYVSRDAISGAATAILPADYIKNRDDLETPITADANVVFYFKTKAERDAALTTIANANAAEYNKRYTAAAAELSKDLTAANTAYYQKALAECAEQKAVNDAQELYNAAKAEYDRMTIIYNNTSSADKEAKELAKTNKDTAKDAMDLRQDELDIAKANLKVADKLLQYDRDQVRKPMINKIVNEFKSAYKNTNFDFDYTSKTETAGVFAVNDSKPQVVQNTVAGGYISGASYTPIFGDDDFSKLEDAYYRTIGNYVSPESYAFTGEIITESERSQGATALELINAYLLDSDRWSLFSVLSQGAATDNNNTTETDKNKDEDEDKDEVTTTWYPSSASYRIPNSDSLSFRGKNNYWYTSSGAAEVYGGGYSGTTLKSNYSDVKGSAKVYFCAMDGKYYTTDNSSYSYLVEENKTTTNNTAIADPYYYYYLLSQNGGYTSTTTKVDPDAPTIYGSSKRSGWTKILTAVKATKNGTVTIDMNAATTIPSDVIKAAAANNVTIKAVNANGSIFTVNGSDVSYATAINTTVQYNVKVVSDSLKNKAIKVNKGAVSTTQVVISEDGDLGADATVTVKLSAKRAGYTVKAYRVSSDGKKLTCEAKGTVKSNGSVNLNLDNGGKYVLVVIK
ncbi:MAG: hypothetical protein IJZ72_09575 [Oscillospiraceae bacterium]|nr:hypothetical protein [Oscillospiraceae bacterium]